MSDISEQLKKLRVPFEKHQISKLPKPYKKDSPKGRCDECGGYHGLPAMHLDYVGHAALTDRLLDVDPTWSWEPLSLDANGLPALDKDGGLWIKLTICGVTRLGYGDAQGKLGGDATKERIGDALRNAAMRFGAALELWHKGILHMDADDTPEPSSAPAPQAKPAAKAAPKQSGPEPDAEIVAKFEAAADIPALTTVMNGLPNDTKRLYTGHFNERMQALKLQKAH